MKEIGEKLKSAREGMGITIDEVSQDLKLEPNKIELLENGDVSSFQDIASIKYFIRDYSKYLGLNKDDLVDEFNEYLFDYTSKLSLEDIKIESKNKKLEENRVRSPYTIERKNDALFQAIAYISIIILIGIIIFLLYSIAKPKDKVDNLVYGGFYERSK